MDYYQQCLFWDLLGGRWSVMFESHEGRKEQKEKRTYKLHILKTHLCCCCIKLHGCYSCSFIFLWSRSIGIGSVSVHGASILWVIRAPGSYLHHIFMVTLWSMSVTYTVGTNTFQDEQSKKGKGKMAPSQLGKHSLDTNQSASCPVTPLLSECNYIAILI